ncbi:MAG: carboxypeptidase-like regulatory domain-containing protein [Bacteroidota bacterium]
MKQLTVFLSLLIPLFLQAQISITGTLLDSQSKESIAYAQLRTPSGWGTITNSEGRFRINLPAHERITITHLAYQAEEIDSRKAHQEEAITFLLVPRPMELEAVIITPIDPIELLEEAVASIPDNHGHDPIMSQAFYREFLQVGDSGVRLNEAVVELYQQGNGVSSHRTSQAQLIKGRSSEAQMPFNNVHLMFGGGGIQSAAGIPVIGSPKAEAFIGKKVYKNYTYTLKDVVSHNGRDTYVIHFDQKRKLRKRLYQGNIYLDTKTLAFVQVDYQTSQRGKKFRFGQIAGLTGMAAKAALRLAGIKLELLDDQGRQQFVYQNGQWYLNSANHQFRANLEKKRGEEQKQYVLDVSRDFVITHYEQETAAHPIPEAQRLNPETSLSKQTGVYDESFWDNYTYLPASTPLYQTINRWHGSQETVDP